MRKSTLVFVVLFWAATTASGQTVSVPFPIPMPFPIPLPPLVYPPPGSSVIDHHGNLVFFDVFLSYPTPTADQPRPAPKAKTHVTVIARDGSKKGFDYEGAFQAAGVGRRAVYAIVSTYTSTPGQVIPLTGGAVAVTTGTNPVYVDRKLVALNVISGTLPASLPSFTPLNAGEVKVAAVGEEAEPDSVTIIEPAPIIGPLPASAIGTFSIHHVVRLLTFDGASFTDVVGDRILVP